MKKNMPFLIKFFDNEEFADAFINRTLYCNRLAYFKKDEKSNFDPVRHDKYEGISACLQKKGIKLEFGRENKKIEITEADLTGSIFASFDENNYDHIFCMYAVLVNDSEKLNLEIQLDERCIKFGNHAVIIVDPCGFLEKVNKYFEKENLSSSLGFVNYYDPEIFNGMLEKKDVIFNKQKRFEYQNEFRITFQTDMLDLKAKKINIGSLHEFSKKINYGDIKKLKFSLLP